MFSGIVHGRTKLVEIKKEEQCFIYIFKFKKYQIKNLRLGNSISHNGCCLTVSKINKNYVSFNVIKETLNNTNLKYLKIGEYVNFERAAKFGDEIGGHIVSGHIITMVKVKKIKNENESYVMWLTVLNSNVMQFIFYKGFICIDGISLTIAKIKKNSFCICLIPETLRITTIKDKKKDDYLNLEVDFFTQTIVSTVNTLVKSKKIL
ncbi:riboflavin synthase subunit alpha [Buchnera aphidicola]|uniref:riboflavin synthase subunit alpha n=1 Tax=Buchnera aphidicola TaxID=9 RepID=UPI0031B73D49